jgi:hypothetical protein
LTAATYASAGVTRSYNERLQNVTNSDGDRSFHAVNGRSARHSSTTGIIAFSDAAVYASLVFSDASANASRI